MMTFGGSIDESNKGHVVLPSGYGGAIVEGSFLVSGNRLESMSFRFPKQIDGFLDISRNRLDSFEGCPIGTTSINAMDNRIHSLINIHKHISSCTTLTISGNLISRGGIGILLIKDINKLIYTNCDQFCKAGDIISKYIKSDLVGMKGLLLCQEELLEAKLDRFAEL